MTLTESTPETPHLPDQPGAAPGPGLGHDASTVKKRVLISAGGLVVALCLVGQVANIPAFKPWAYVSFYKSRTAADPTPSAIAAEACGVSVDQIGFDGYVNGTTLDGRGSEQEESFKTADGRVVWLRPSFDYYSHRQNGWTPGGCTNICDTLTPQLQATLNIQC